jgi:hypothetical protein
MRTFRLTRPSLRPIVVGFAWLVVQAPARQWAGPRPADAPPVIEFRAPVSYAVGDRPRSAAAGDFNGDGHLDLAVTNLGTRNISILLGRGDGTFGPQTSTSCGPFPTLVATGDFDGDGDLDLSSNYFGATGSTSGFVCLAVGHGDGTFDPGVLDPISFHPAYLAPGDFDGDSRDDVAAGGAGSGLSILSGRVDGTLAPEHLLLPDTGTGFNSTLMEAMVAGDLDGDGLDDLMGASHYATECGPGTDVWIQLSLGGGAFQFQAGPFAVCVAGVTIADLDADGFPDVAVTSDDIEISLNLGDASFGPAAHSEALGLPSFGDFNGDGMKDLLLENTYANVLSARPGLSPTTFGDVVTIAAANVPIAFGATGLKSVIGDFDEDGRDDLAVAQEAADTIAVLLAGTTPPNLPPTAAAGLDLSAECASAAGASVHLDGSGSSDPDSSSGTDDGIAAYDWLENFGLPSQQLLGSGRTLDAVLPLGPHLVTLRVTDTAGETATDDVLVTVVDTTPPALSASVAPAYLWPPHHQMSPVHVTPDASDLCGGASVALVAVQSSEPDDAEGAGDGSTTDDIQGASIGAADFDVMLRAERQSTGGGRTYTLTYRATDASGNSTDATARVLVPQSRQSLLGSLKGRIRTEPLRGPAAQPVP